MIKDQLEYKKDKMPRSKIQRDNFNGPWRELEVSERKVMTACSNRETMEN